MALYFEDFPAGRIDRFGRYAVSREEALAFATAYDPQPFHLDDAAAAANPVFGRLSTSGWHTAAMAMRMTVDHWAALGVAAMGAAGLDELSWLRPVFPGDTLRLKSEVIEARPSRSLPEIGLLKIRTITVNQDDVAVMRQIANVLLRRRPASP